MDWILGIGSMLHIGLMTNNWKYAGYVGLLLQGFWLFYALTTLQYGLLVSGIGFTIMHCITIWKWHLKLILIKGNNDE
jgi:hypothetical protein